MWIISHNCNLLLHQHKQNRNWQKKDLDYFIRCQCGKVSKQWYERFVVFGMKLTIKGINTCVVGIILFVSCPAGYCE